MIMSKISDLIPDSKNANKGTARGSALLTKSIDRNGIGRGIVVDKNGVIIGGNKTHEEIGQSMGDVGIIEVETDGNQLVVTKRIDLDLNSSDPDIRRRSRELALADNRVQELDFEVDVDVLKQYEEEDNVDLSEYYFESELNHLLDYEENGDDYGDLKNMFPDDNQENLVKKRLIVNFLNLEDYYRFSELMGQKLTEKTNSIWFPESERESLSDYTVE